MCRRLMTSLPLCGGSGKTKWIFFVVLGIVITCIFSRRLMRLCTTLALVACERKRLMNLVSFSINLSCRLAEASNDSMRFCRAST